MEEDTRIFPGESWGMKAATRRQQDGKVSARLRVGRMHRDLHLSTDIEEERHLNFAFIVKDL